MTQQRKQYLRLAENATEPHSKLFYALMAEVAPEVNGMARKHVNRVGATVIYDVVLRATSALLMETAFNLGRGAIDVDRLKADFALALDDLLQSQQVLEALPCTPKMDS